MKHISVSQIGVFTTCARKWYLQYHQGLGVRRLSDVSPMSLGDLVHQGLAAGLKRVYALRKRSRKTAKQQQTLWNNIDAAIVSAITSTAEAHKPQAGQGIKFDDGTYIPVEPSTKFIDEWNAMQDSAIALAQAALRNLDVVTRYKVVAIKGEPAVEFRLEYPILVGSKRYLFVGAIDALLYDNHTGANVLVDFKVRRNFTGAEAEYINSQLALYQYILKAGYGVDTFYAMVYQIKNQAPRKPDLNKDGSMSRRAITTTWDVYEAALIEAGLNPDDYRDEMQNKLATVEFYRPILIPRTIDFAATFYENFKEQVATLQIMQERGIFPRVDGYACRTCPFNALCTAEVYKLDVEEVIAAHYEYRELVTDSEEDDEQSTAD